MTKPITPEEVTNHKFAYIPSQIIEIFNDLIIAKYRNGAAKVLQKDVVADILAKTPYTATELFENNWLDVEMLYEENGWCVEFDKPGYNENYNACWVFTRKT